MILQFTKLDFDSISGQLLLEGFTDVKSNDGLFIIQQYMDVDELVLPKSFSVNVSLIDSKFSTKINISEYSVTLTAGNRWDFYFKCNNEKVRINLKNLFTGKLNCNYHYLENSLYECKPYVTNEKDLCLWTQTIAKLKVNLAETNYSDSTFNSIICIENSPLQINQEDINLVFMKRENKNLNIYTSETIITLDRLNDNTFSFKLTASDVVSQYKINDEDLWDCFLSISNAPYSSVLIPVNIDNSPQKHYSNVECNTFYSSKFFVTGNKTLALWIKQTANNPFVCNTLTCSENLDVTIKAILPQNIIVKKLFIKSRNASMTRENPFNISLPFTQNNHDLTTFFSFYTLALKSKLQDKLIYDIFAEVTDIKTNSYGVFPLIYMSESAIRFNYYHLDNSFESKPYLTKLNSIAFFIRKKLITSSKNPIKIAVLGSCYSRLPFSSLQYFNPSYKEKYEVCYTQFHSSIPSIMSNPVHFEEEYFKNNKPQLIEYARCDFEKTFFEKLKNSSPDYLIIDLYADAVRDLIVLDDDHIITGTFLIRRSEYFLEIANKATLISHKQIDKYIQYWEKSICSFIDKLTKIVPEDHIILNSCRMSERYYDNNGTIQCFNDRIPIIKRSNYFFEYFEEYLMSKIPKIQTLDLSEYNYLAHFSHPEGLSPNHYEQDYYKKFLIHLDDIILKNKTS